MTERHIYQFWTRRFRKADCGICWAVVSQNRAKQHARWHWNARVIPSDPIRSSTAEVLEIELDSDGTVHNTSRGCWQVDLVG